MLIVTRSTHANVFGPLLLMHVSNSATRNKINIAKCIVCYNNINQSDHASFPPKQNNIELKRCLARRQISKRAEKLLLRALYARHFSVRSPSSSAFFRQVVIPTR